MHVLLYLAAVVCAFAALAFWPLLILALVLAGLGLMVKNSRAISRALQTDEDRMASDTRQRVAVVVAILALAVFVMMSGSTP